MLAAPASIAIITHMLVQPGNRMVKIVNSQIDACQAFVTLTNTHTSVLPKKPMVVLA